MHVFEQKLAASWAPQQWQDHTLLVAVSGGADSVALLRAIHALKSQGDGRLIVGHFNHRVRGAQSDADEQFVLGVAQALELQIVVRDDRSKASSGSTDEESLRNARYTFLQQQAEATGARYVVTAHTANDQVETILHRILRGTGIAGLAGVPRNRPLGDAAVLMRPMLQITRQEVVKYLSDLRQPYCEDASNVDVNYTRNRIRHELLPLLSEQYNPGIQEAVLRLGQLAGEAQIIVDRMVDTWMEARVRVHSPSHVEVDCSLLGSDDRPVVRSLLAAIWKAQAWALGDMGFAEWDRLACLATSESNSSTDLPGPVRAQKKAASLSLTRLG